MVAPPHMPVLPPWGTMPVRVPAQTVTTAATSAVLAGRTPDARQFSPYVDVPLANYLADGPDEVTKALRPRLQICVPA